jgi:hypothetical protein
LERGLEADRPEESTREHCEIISEVMAVEDAELKAETKAVEKGIQNEEVAEQLQ